MEGILSILLVLLVLTNQLQRIASSSQDDEKIEIKRQLQLINKPPIKSFQTKYGDILDCVDIYKQLAFDHPLLKNHTIQMKPSIKVSTKSTSTRDSSVVLKASQFLPKSMRCPRGTVPIKRIDENDLAMEKFTPLLGTTFGTTNSSKSIEPNDDIPPGHQIATLVTFTDNFGASGSINVWNPSVLADQLSDASIYVASDDGYVSNSVATGWMVNPYISKDSYTRLYAYWTKDSGRSTGCFNLLCPGFVQVSQKVSLGFLVDSVSIYNGTQYYIHLTILQDPESKDWWVYYETEGVGYYPKKLFSTLTNGATRAGWGGEISSPTTEAAPGMGSGHFPEEGLTNAAVIHTLGGTWPKSPPKPSDQRLVMSKPDCYKVTSPLFSSGFGQYIMFGGPPNCKL